MSAPDWRRAAIYCRVATIDQMTAAPWRGQEVACRQYAARHRYAVAEAHVYREVAGGLRLTGRPQLAALREAIGAGRVDAIIVRSRDRLGRDRRTVRALEDECARAGVEIVVVAEAGARGGRSA